VPDSDVGADLRAGQRSLSVGKPWPFPSPLHGGFNPTELWVHYWASGGILSVLCAAPFLWLHVPDYFQDAPLI